jgi:hypothetical protein
LKRLSADPDRQTDTKSEQTSKTLLISLESQPFAVKKKKLFIRWILQVFGKDCETRMKNFSSQMSPGRAREISGSWQSLHAEVRKSGG